MSACKGMNCGCTDGVSHSVECKAEYAQTTEKIMKLSGDHNQCAGCGEHFNSTAAFDKHRIGQFGIDRRCASVDEISVKGMIRNRNGWWITGANPMFAETCTSTRAHGGSEC